jgi:hypothetical protein
MKRPLVLTAPAKVIEQARDLGITRPVENAIEEAIIAGRLPGGDLGESPVYLGDGVVCVCRKQRTNTGRKGWKPVRVTRVQGRAA